MRRLLPIFVFAALLLATGAALADQFVTLESHSMRGMFVRHQNWQAVLTNVVSDLDKKDATFALRSGLAGGALVSFESVNYPGMYLRHKNWVLVLEKNDGSQQFASDASFKKTTLLGMERVSTGFEASNFPGFFLRHKNFKMVLERNDGTSQFKDDSGFLIDIVPNPAAAEPPPPQATGDDEPNCTITADVDVYPQPGQDNGQQLPSIAKGEKVFSDRQRHRYYFITGANVPNGAGWVYRDYISCP